MESAEYVHLVYPNEIKDVGRPIGRVDEARLMAYITEVEQMYVKPAFGDELFLKIIEQKLEEPYRLLLDGGIYNGKCGSKKYFKGLRTAIVYFIQAQNVMSGDYQQTRYGVVVKDGDYSSRVSSKERSDYYNNLLEIANFYLKECIDYCRNTGIIKRSGRPMTAGSLRIAKIG